MPRRAVLFDIDGTLLKAGGAGRRALALAARQVTGRGMDEVGAAVAAIDLRGNTDARILAALSAGLGVNLVAGTFMPAYLAALDATLRDSSVQRLPGVSSLLAELAAADVYVGLLTGNWRAGAYRKLAAIELEHLTERHGGFGDDGETRPEVAQVAASRLERSGIGAADVVVIGDTPHDVSAAHAAGMRAIAVASGWSSRAELEVCGAALVVDDLTDAAVLEVVCASAP